MTMPNFFIIGAGSSGTTSLYNYLNQHPQVFVSPIKETNFFSTPNQEFPSTSPLENYKRTSVVNSLEEYQGLFREASKEIAIGEVSPSYLYAPSTPKRIWQSVPNAKIVAILRNPVDKIYSGYKRCVRNGQEPITNFEEAIRQESIRIQEDWHPRFFYKLKGFYYKYLKQYSEFFEKDNIRVYLYEDLCKDPINLMQNLFQFLDIDSKFVPNMAVKHNVSYIPRSKYLKLLLGKPNPIKSILKLLLPQKLSQSIVNNLKVWNQTKPQLVLDTRRQLILEYREDILKLQELIERDLSKWLEVAAKK